MKRIILILNLLANTIIATGQSDTLIKQDSFKQFVLDVSGEMYLGVDFANPITNERPFFVYNEKITNQVSLNLLRVKGTYRDEQIRASFGLMAGTYPQFNYATEPLWAHYVYEALIGFKLSKKHNWWLDAGIFPAHIGFETPINSDNWTLTRSIVAENSPYYESGFNFNFLSKREKVFLGIFVLNGWQRIYSRLQFTPSLGFQLSLRPGSKFFFNYSNYIGLDEYIRNLGFIKFYNDFYTTVKVSKKADFIFGFDIGIGTKFTPENYFFYSPVTIFKVDVSRKVSLAYRLEYYSDVHNINVKVPDNLEFQVFGTSANVDLKIGKYILFRNEIKYYRSINAPIFYKETQNNMAFTSNLNFRLIR